MKRPSRPTPQKAPRVPRAPGSQTTPTHGRARRARPGRGVWLQGGCHCGSVRFRVRVENKVALECNCQICVKKGNLHLLVADHDFELLSDQESLSVYTFGGRIAQHRFCRKCGVHPFYRPHSPPDPTQWDVNVRCLDDVVISDFRIEFLDGNHIETTVVAALKASFPRRSLERRYIELCERGVYDPAAQGERLGVSVAKLDELVRRLQRNISSIGARLVASPEAPTRATPIDTRSSRRRGR